jgi:uncharacterized membrane protein YdbT with pleckstrin-like domain
MGYVEQSLSTGERVILKARLHWGMFLGPLIGILIAVLVIALSALPFLVPYSTVREFDAHQYGFQVKQGEPLLSENEFNEAQPIAGICCAGCAVLWFLLAILRLLTRISIFFTSEFAVTNKRVIGKSGALRRRSLEIMLSKIESVSVDEPFWGRILNYGTIVVKGSGGTSQPFPFISDAMGLRLQINNLIPPAER